MNTENGVTVIKKIKADKNKTPTDMDELRNFCSLFYLAFFSFVTVTPLASDLLKRAFLEGF
jgi:hypothetical protein